MPGAIRRQSVVLPDSKDEPPFAEHIPPPVVAQRETKHLRHNRGPEQSNGWVPMFLKKMEDGESILVACNAAGVSTVRAYQLRRDNVDFKAAWNAAADIGTRLLEQEAQRRAYHGVEKPVFYKGEIVGYTREYSDTLLMFMLRSRKPEVYREGHGDGADRSQAINVTVVNVDAEREKVQSEQARLSVVDAAPEVSAEAKAAYEFMKPPEVTVVVDRDRSDDHQ